MYKFEALKEKDKIVSWIKEFFEINGKGCNAVIGISGGKDSTLIAKLCVEALGADRVIGVMMPCGVQKDISDSILKRKYANAEWAPVAVAMYYRGEQERGIDYWEGILKGRDHRNEKDELFLKKYRCLPPYDGDI